MALAKKAKAAPVVIEQSLAPISLSIGWFLDSGQIVGVGSYTQIAVEAESMNQDQTLYVGTLNQPSTYTSVTPDELKLLCEEIGVPYDIRDPEATANSLIETLLTFEPLQDMLTASPEKTDEPIQTEPEETTMALAKKEPAAKKAPAAKATTKAPAAKKEPAAKKSTAALKPAKLNSLADGKPAKATKPKREVLEQNGVRQPSAATASGTIWAQASAMEKKLKRPPTPSEILEALPELSSGTVRTQLANWRKFNGHEGRAAA